MRTRRWVRRHHRANYAFCICGRRFFTELEQARHEQWSNLTALQRARLLERKCDGNAS